MGELLGSAPIRLAADGSAVGGATIRVHRRGRATWLWFQVDDYILKSSTDIDFDLYDLQPGMEVVLTNLSIETSPG